MIVSVPFLIRYARSAFAEVNPDVLDAARLLGRSEINIFFSVAIPIAWRGVATAIIMAFARALGDFGTTLMVSGDIPGYTRTMPLAVYDAIQAGDINLANKLVIIMTVTAVILLFLLNSLKNRTIKGRQ